MATRMQQRRGTAAQWTASNPVLNAGEIGYESDTNKFKIGDGTNHWVALAYFLDEDTIGTSLDGFISESLLGANNGVAQLNSTGKLVSTQIPNVDEITQDAINTALVAGTGLDKTYDDAGNTITLDIDSTVATLTGTQTLTNKTVALGSNTVSGTISQFNTSVTDADLATLAGTETLTNKTLTSPIIATVLNGAATITMPVITGTVALTSDISAATGGSVSETGTQTLSNKTLTAPVINNPTGLTKSDVGLANVDNTTDANKPVSTLTQTALDNKVSLSAPAIDYYITNSGSGAYLVNGVSNGTIHFEKGKKYRVVVSASGHPFWIQTVSGAYSSGDVYSSGITNNGAQDGSIIVELPQNAPASLYYACQYHSSMAGSVAVGNIAPAVQTALDLKAPLASPALTGVPTAPTAAVATNTTQVATTAYVRGEVAALVNSATSTLDTLGEIATALGNDASLSTTLTNAIALKAPLASPTFTGAVDFTGATVTGISSYNAPTLGSTSIASGATVTTVAGLTLTAPTLTGTVTASGDINLSAANGPGSLIDELALILMGAL